MNSLTAKAHYPILDGLRGVAALIVVAMHIFEPNAANSHEMIINHGYLAVDFFFALSGFVIGYAYDDRWGKMTVGTFFRRRLERLQPLVIMGMIIGTALFYFSDSPTWPLIHTVPVWKVLLTMLVGFTLLPLPVSMDIRGWQEMHPLNGPGWSLFYEYVANILYAVGVRKLSNKALAGLVVISGVGLVYYTLTCKSGDVMGGWSLNKEQLTVGFIRLFYPFFAGLLLSRVIQPGRVRHAFLMSSLLLGVLLCMPRIGGSEDVWKNGLYEAMSIILMFPLIVFIGASGRIESVVAGKVCRFLGDISYPVYITHFPFIYVYSAWVSRNPGAALEVNVLYGVVTFLTAVIVGVVMLKYYDEPVRRWLKGK